MHSYRRTMMGLPKGEPLNIENYLTIVALEDDFQFKFDNNLDNKSGVPTGELQYCVDGNFNWIKIEFDEESPKFKKNQSVSFRGNLRPVIGSNSSTSYGVGTFYLYKNCYATGDAMSLIFGDEAKDNYSLEGYDYAFKNLFYSSGMILYKGLVYTSPTLLKATTLSNYCYHSMFALCYSLTTGPDLPATTLADNCYSMMFSYCKSLTTAPALPAMTLSRYCYDYMFANCESLTTAPELPATDINYSCYAMMFLGCTSLVTPPPVLPAEVVNGLSYQGMFMKCTSLKTTPLILAKTNMDSSRMFKGCTSLTTAPELPATDIGMHAYESMFEGCTALTTGPSVLPASIDWLSDSCYYRMFYGCTSLVTPPKLPSTTLTSDCYSYMFDGCKSLTTAPDLPAPELIDDRGDIADGCYNYMFYNCTNLNYINASFTTTPGTDYTLGWVTNVAPTGTFVKSKDATWDVRGKDGVPEGWTIKHVIDRNEYLSMYDSETSFKYKFTNPTQYCVDGINWIDLPADTLSPTFNKDTHISIKGDLINSIEQASGCGMFTLEGSNINVYGTPMSLLYGDNASAYYQAPDFAFVNLFSAGINIKHVSSDFLLYITELGQHCYSSMFLGTNIEEAPILPATTLTTSCYNNMFNGCNRLTTLHKGIGNTYLPATTLASHCYHAMFQGCDSLTDSAIANYLPILPATTLADYCYFGMFYSCTSLTVTPKLPATTLAERCYASMFSGCTSLTTAPELPVLNLKSGCYSNMFSGCTALTTAPALPATTLKDYCYNNMFSGCTALVNAPILPAKTLVMECYQMMFYNCSNLNCIEAAFTTTPGTDYTLNWVSGVAPTGTFKKAFDATWDVRGVNGVPVGWDVITLKDPDLINNYLTINITGITNDNKGPYTLNLVNIFGNTSSGTIKDLDVSSTYDIYYNLNYTSWEKLTNNGVPVQSGDTVLFKTTSMPTTVNFDSFDSIPNGYGYGTFICLNSTGYATPITTTLSGNILSMGYGSDAKNADTCYDGHFIAMFPYIGCTSVSKNFLPATNLGELCYMMMFQDLIQGGTLTAAPALPATTLASSCYAMMFYGCTSLTTAPELSATTLAERCYASMFNGCTSLTTAPELSATTLANACYSSMFEGCTSLTAAPALPATTLADGCYYGMFSGCTSLTTAPKLPATTLASSCYAMMFYGCTSLTAAPALPATTLASSCYHMMFYSCKSLTAAPALPATTLAYALDDLYGCYDGMFWGCTSLVSAPKLPATELTKYCYRQMFESCTSLTTAPKLPATTLADNCYSRMFEGCTALTKAPKLPATTLAPSCYLRMFSNCTSLTKAPYLPAKTLVDGCYNSMFRWCYDLEYINAAFTTTPSSNYMHIWVESVNSTGTFVKAPDATWDHDAVRGRDGIPTGWNVIVGDGTEPEEPENDDEKYVVITPLTSNDYSVSWIKTDDEVDVATPLYVKYADSSDWDMYNYGETINIQGGKKIYLKSYYTQSHIDNMLPIGIINITNTTYNVSGNSLALIYGDDAIDNIDTKLPAGALVGLFMSDTNLISVSENFLPATTLADACYGLMFSDCQSLTNAPALPATALAIHCYFMMFAGCSSLTAAPALPATTLATSCYSNMFNGCTSLTAAPTLPATTLADSCYQMMFYNCTSLTTAPALPATTLADNCYEGMFNVCTSLTTAPTLPATTLAIHCYEYMFAGCSSLTAAPVLPATTLADNCYYSMFASCTSLTTAPELPATTLVTKCYQTMFNGCTNLNYINASFTTTPGTDYTLWWVEDVAPTGTFVKAHNATWNVRGANGIPSGWDVVVDNNTVSTYDLRNRNVASQRKCWYATGSDWSGDTISSDALNVPDGFDGFYSISNCDPDNLGIYDSSAAKLKINFTGYDTFEFYIRSNTSAYESNYDYVIVGNLDEDNMTESTIYTSPYVYANTRGNASSDESLEGYTKVTFENCAGDHSFVIMYRKDASGSAAPDRGYVLIPKV